MTWLNSDGLFVKFAKEEGISARGGSPEVDDSGLHRFIFTVNYTDMLSASTQILGASSGVDAGSLGIMIPKGLRVTEIETFAETAFTSSGTIGSSTLVLGLIREDRTTELDYDGFTTTSVVGSTFDAAGETNVIRVGSTGAGALIGTTLANNGYITVSNSAHASHPYTAGKLIVQVKGYFPV